ncbi:MAG: hypothetical protein ACLTEH_05630 [Clostridia bacterium]
MKKKLVSITTDAQEVKELIIKELKKKRHLFPIIEGKFEMQGYFPSKEMLRIISKLILNEWMEKVDIHVVSQEEPKQLPPVEEIEKTPEKELTIQDKVRLYIEKNGGQLDIEQMEKELEISRISIRNALTALKKKNILENSKRGFWIKAQAPIETEVKQEVVPDVQIKTVKQDNIYKNVDYESVVKYIMSRKKFTVEALRQKFPEDNERIPKIIKEMVKKDYIIEDRENIGSYYVELAIRIYYFIQKNPKTTIAKMKAEMPLEDAMEMQRKVKMGLESNILYKTEQGGYILKRPL